MSRRARQKKAGKLEPGFSPLYEDALKTEMVRTLSPAVFKFYIVACALSKPWNNGAVPLVRSVLKEFGIVSGYAINHAITDLLERKLIVRTQKARPRHAALYGVTHLPLNHEAMLKKGIRVPDGRSTPSVERTECENLTPSTMQTECSVRSADREWSAQRTELTPNDGNSVRPADRIPPFSASHSVRSADTSKNLPGATGIPGEAKHGF